MVFINLRSLYRFIVFATLSIFIPTTLFAEDPVLTPKTTAKINMAVADFNGLNVSQADASIMTNFLRTELVSLGSFNIMDRNNMDTVLAEQKFQASGCTEQQCAVEMGKLLSVRQMVIGSLSKLLESYYITVNLLDVETGRIIASYDAEASSGSELKKASRILAQKIQAGGEVPQKAEKKQSLPQPIIELSKTRAPEIKNLPATGNWALGGIYPGASLKYVTGGKSAWELKAQSGSGILAIGPRYYRYFTRAANPRLFFGMEADYITFKSKVSKGTGFAGGAFIGGEIFLTKQIGLLIDFGPMFLSLNENTYSQSDSGLDYVANIGIYWHFM